MNAIAGHSRPRDASVDLLWTGGWDSTFRLLQLLLLHRVPVVPHYLEDPARASTRIELQTMSRIRERLLDAHPHVDALLQPPRIVPVDGIGEDDGILDALRAVRRRSFIGSQYAWLPAYCKQNGIAGMELGVHVDDKVQALLQPFAEGFEHPAGFRSMRVGAAHAGSAEFALFRYFSFPLFGIDKLGIDRQARDEGWDPIMDMTWFCHSPSRGRPCGICAPCVYTIEEGLARRVPVSRRTLSFFYRSLVLPLKAPARSLQASLRDRRAERPPASSRLADP